MNVWRARVCARAHPELVLPNPVVVVEKVDRYSLLILGFGGWTNLVRARARARTSLCTTSPVGAEACTPYIRESAKAHVAPSVFGFRVVSAYALAARLATLPLVG